jgi:ribosomal protein S18 acetylase RimI-like enzyme
VIEFRCFRNDDPPRLADAWRWADLGPAAMQPMTSTLLESAVFSKPYFDREGLIVAVEDGRAVGFAHAGFGPNADRSALDTTVGATFLVVVVPHAEEARIGAELLARCEDYLRRRGATTLLGGGSPAMRSFYLGLYGGADLPGILDTSPGMQACFRRGEYVDQERIVVLRRPLTGYRPPVNRLQLAIRRATTMRVIDEPARRTWWEAATTNGIGLRRYELRGVGEDLLGTATFWDVQPLASAWGASVAGLLHTGIEGARRREGLAHYMVAESLHDLAQEGAALAETHVAAENAAALGLFTKLGFAAAAHGTVFRRQ